MPEQSVMPVFDKLLDEIAGVIASLNEEGAHLFSEGEYERARALLNKVESITGFRGKVLILRDEWKALNVPAVPERPPSGEKQPDGRPKTTSLKRGVRTSSGDFRYPILEALVRLDGAGSVGEVLGIVGEIMAEELNVYDFHPLPSDPDSVRWKNTAQWERYNMVQEGLLASDSKRGTWEITEAGREALRHAKDNPDLQRKLFSAK